MGVGPGAKTAAVKLAQSKTFKFIVTRLTISYAFAQQIIFVYYEKKKPS